MTSFRTLKMATTVALAGAAGLLTSCLQAPDFPIVPHIDLKELKVVRMPASATETTRDVVDITIEFTDGDGNLGLSDKETAAPYNTFTPDGIYNPKGDNYHVTAYKRSNPNASFEKVVLGQQGLNSRFPILYDEGHVGPLKGTLTWNNSFSLGNPFRPGDEVKFEISILDRDMNESNTVTTNTFIVAKQ